MATTVTGIQAAREAVQPSLWDRLVDDLPGLVVELDQRRELLEKELGRERLATIIAGGSRAIEKARDLDDETRKSLHTLLGQVQKRAFLEEKGIVVTPGVLREAVRRDIEMLFNCERMEVDPLFSDLEKKQAPSPASLLADFPEARRSVINYGVPAFAGRTGRDFNRDTLAREIKDILAVFEPRLKRDSIRVRVGGGERTGLKIDVDAVLLLTPVPERLRLSTSIDMDNGKAVTKLDDA